MFKLVKVTREIYEATRDDWLERLDNMSLLEPVPYTLELDRLEEAVEENSKENSHVYALVKSGDELQSAQAVLLIIHVKHGKDAPRMKVLNLRLNPRFDLEGYEKLDSAFMKEWSDVVASAIVHALGLTFEDHPSNELKLHARTEHMYGLFQAIATKITENGGIEGLDVMYHNLWLVFKKKPPFKVV